MSSSDDLFDLARAAYSERERAQRGEQSGELEFHHISPPVRAKIVMLLKDSASDDYHAGFWYERMGKAINRYLGREELPEHREAHPITSMHEYLEAERDTEAFLSAVELLFAGLKTLDEKRETDHARARSTSGYIPRHEAKLMDAENACRHLNEIFQRHRLGFRFENDKIIRIDSTHVHAEIVHPTLMLLSDPYYSGANQEYLKAHEHYRHREYPACVVECRKAFESVMKIICVKRQWVWKEPAVVKNLIAACLDNRLLPAANEDQLAGLQKVLAAATLASNKPGGGHGQGDTPAPVHPHIAAYTLHLTAANILFFVQAEHALP